MPAVVLVVLMVVVVFVVAAEGRVVAVGINVCAANIVVVVVAAEGRVLGINVEPSCAAGVRVPPAASGKRGAAEPLVVGVKGCAGEASGAAAPARGNGLNALIPVAGVTGALPMTGDGLNVVDDVARGADAPNKGKGLNTLPPAVAFVVITVVCCNVRALAWTGSNTRLIRTDGMNLFMVRSWPEGEVRGAIKA